MSSNLIRSGARFAAALAFALCGVLNTSKAFAQGIDNAGKDFIVSFIRNPLGGGLQDQVTLQLTANEATDVTVQYPVNAPTFDTTVAVAPGTITNVTLPIDASLDWTPNSAQNNAVRAFAPKEFVMYMTNRRSASSDAALALPIDTMNKEYIVTTYNEVFDKAQFIVTAAFDNTTVTVTPSNDLVGGQLKGVPFNFTINRGEGYMLQQATSGTNGGLAGTIVQSDKPVGMTNGNGCTQVPVGTTACDGIFEIAQPIQTWGNQALVVNLPNRVNGSIYRLIPSQDATEFFQDGVSIGTKNKGEFLEIGPLPGSHVFSSAKPIFVVQYMTGVSSPGAISGDPAMGNMIPPEQFLKAYTFAAVGDQQFSQHWLTVIANNDDLATILLDGAPIGAGAFTAIAGTSFSSATIQITAGTHNTSSNKPHGITVEGYNSADSYLYPGGASFSFINPSGDANPPICTVNFLNGKYNGTGTDNRPSEDTNSNGVLDAGEDVNGNNQIDVDAGVFFVELLPGATNLTLDVPAFVPGSGSVGFTITPVDANLDWNGTVKVTDGAGNNCTSVIAPLPDVDCAGTPKGTKVNDRCGVCGGDGTSCLGCKTVDVSATLFTLDGTAALQRDLVNQMASKVAAKAKNGTVASLATSAKAQAQSLYLESWTLAWSLDSSITSCSNQEFCVSTANSAISTYSANTGKFNALVKSLNAQIRKQKNGAQLAKIFNRKADRLTRLANRNAKKVPSTSSKCSDANLSA